MPRVEQVQQKALDEFREKNINSGKRKKKKTQQMNESIVTFLCLFFLLSLVFLQMVKSLTPKIDTAVENNTVEETPELRDSKMKVDDRLKAIQLNDSLGTGDVQRRGENNLFNTSLDEIVVIPSHKKQVETTENKTDKQELEDRVNQIISKNTEGQTNKPENTMAPVPNDNANQGQTANSAKPEVVAPTYKVFVGLYQTLEQAQTAKSILKESTLGQNAFVKLTKEGYTLQIGSYSTKPQAETMVQALRVNNFPLARMAEEN